MTIPAPVRERAPAPEAPAGPHIVDVLIRERAPKLSQSPLWPALRALLYPVLDYAKATQMADAIAPMGGREAMEYISRLLHVRPEAQGLERLPHRGRVLIIANHPTGITDGIAVYDAVKTIRPDVMIYANSDAHRVCARFDEILIPVEWVLAKRTRERTRLTLKLTERAMLEERPLLIFPAGRLARMREGLLTDPEWMATAVSLARKYEAPILPMHVSGPWAAYFHFFSRISPELRDITLFRELLNKAGRTYRLAAGPLIGPEHAQGDAATITRRIKHYVERVLAHDRHTPFDPAGPECD